MFFRMMVFWEQRLVVLATPKTGSTALETALEHRAAMVSRRPPEIKHTPAYRYRRFLAPWLEKTAGEPFQVVALMREPVDWLGSWYRFRQRQTRPRSRHDTSGMSFDDFVEGYIAKPRPGFADVGSQSRFLSDGKGVGVDRIFAYERMPEFVGYLSEKLGQSIVLQQENVSPVLTLTLSPEIHARFRAACPEDFALYQSII